MADCSNVDIRELLPERASGALSAADLARVEAHLASCGMCASELALIQSVRAALRHAPAIDVARIAGAVRAATSTPTRPVLVDAAGARSARRFTRSRWIGWKAAAAVAIAAAGGGTMLLSHRVEDASTPPGPVAATAAGASAIAPTSGAGPGVEPASPAKGTASAVAVRPALNVAGGLADLSDSDLRTLLDDIGSLGVDAQSFEEPQSVLPELPGSEGTNS